MGPETGFTKKTTGCIAQPVVDSPKSAIKPGSREVGEHCSLLDLN